MAIYQVTIDDIANSLPHLVKGDQLNITFKIDCVLLVLPLSNAFTPDLNGHHAMGANILATFTGEWASAGFVYCNTKTLTMHSIHTGSGSVAVFKKIAYEEIEAFSHATDQKEGEFARCWPCFSSIAKDLLHLHRLPIPEPTKEIIEAIVEVGDKVYRKGV